MAAQLADPAISIGGLGAGAQPGHAAHLPEPHADGGKARRPACRLFATLKSLRVRSPGAHRGHHRHQRQVDDDGADRPHLAGAGARSAAISAAARSTWHPSARTASMCWNCLPTSWNSRDVHANVAVWLNVTPDHLDRHGDMAGYVAAKQHVFDRQATATARSSASTTNIPPKSSAG